MPTAQFAPPEGAPPPRVLHLPYFTPDECRRFAVRGWAPLDLTLGASPIGGVPVDEFVQAFSALFDASASFFDAPLPYKERFIRGVEGSEDGFNRVQGEKEMITIRTGDTTPDGVREKAAACWDLCGTIMLNLIDEISSSLCLENTDLHDMVEPCARLPPSGDRVATLLRMFCYERGAGKPLGNEPGLSDRRIVAERHRDLGLLSLVVGSSPGLEVWDPYASAWYAIEEHRAEPGKLTATILAGETLARLTNHKYSPGGHRVVVSDLDTSPYRFSLVYALRAHHPVQLDTARLTTAITGPFVHPLTAKTAGELYDQISNAHFNINADVNQRRKQEERLKMLRQQSVGVVVGAKEFSSSG
ncbi:hypothetical protein CALCODRAFT_318084 [Calocera cornea HHB12733]|uniref:Clavaminate synthase-like protein n=1 Tax=Calocera cornea HHB12733 TaxID=1353952 RepID=A0A165F9A2_9BASI|nr:hypothetical protein CALCODRAFT_318084 [Calocera cornea HHB12733]